MEILNEMVYAEKLTLHIPHYTFKNGALEPVDYYKAENGLFAELEEIGIASSYTVTALARYKGREYTEDLVTVFCTPADAPRVVLAFNHVYFNGNDIMQQEAFAYERNGNLHVYDLPKLNNGY